MVRSLPTSLNLVALRNLNDTRYHSINLGRCDLGLPPFPRMRIHAEMMSPLSASPTTSPYQNSQVTLIADVDTGCGTRTMHRYVTSSAVTRPSHRRPSTIQTLRQAAKQSIGHLHSCRRTNQEDNYKRYHQDHLNRPCSGNTVSMKPSLTSKQHSHRHGANAVPPLLNMAEHSAMPNVCFCERREGDWAYI